jgi:hypothetical protein
MLIVSTVESIMDDEQGMRKKGFEPEVSPLPANQRTTKSFGSVLVTHWLASWKP